MSDLTLRPGGERALRCHPETLTHLAQWVRSFTAGAARLADGGLLFHYVLSGDLIRLRIPAPAPSGRRDGLWQHTCCEAFVGLVGNPAYREFNFSPAGQWAAFAFADYRRPQATDEAENEAAPPPAIATWRSLDRLELTARVAADLLPREAATRTLQIGLTAVIESAGKAENGQRSYWALKHAPGPADFHHPATFVLELPAP